MKKYPALKVVSLIYQVAGVLTAIGLFIASLTTANPIVIVVGALLAVIAGASLYAGGELITLIVRIGRNAEVSSEALARLYMDRKNVSLKTRRAKKVHNEKDN